MTPTYLKIGPSQGNVRESSKLLDTIFDQLKSVDEKIE